MWANLRQHLNPSEELEPPDPDAYPRLPLLISNHQGSAPVAGHASQRPAAAQPQLSNCSDYKSVIQDYKSYKHTELFNFDNLTLRQKQFLFKYFYDIMHKIQQNLGNIPRSVEGNPGYQLFVSEYLKPLTVESTLTLEKMTQEQQAYLFVYFYKKIVELGLTLNQFQEIKSLVCSDYLGGKKKVKKFRVSKTKKMRRSLLSRRRRNRNRSHKRHRS